MVKVYDWTAIRSGASITVAGHNMTRDEQVRVTGVDRIYRQRADGKVVAQRGADLVAELV